VSLLIPLLSASPFNSIVMLDYLCCFEEFKPWTRISLTAGYDQDFGVFLMWNMSMCELWPWFNFYALDFYEGHDSDFEPTLLLLMCFFCLCSWHLVKHDDDCIMKLLLLLSCPNAISLVRLHSLFFFSIVMSPLPHISMHKKCFEHVSNDGYMYKLS